MGTCGHSFKKKRYLHDRVIQLFCISALGIMAMSAMNAERIYAADGPESIMKAMRLFGNHADIQEYDSLGDL